ncbi:GDSL esterase/lipase ESM1 [Frankliniella fusca]|uniref:GDSL esterase/lipase ESM1 n=1 Tax=Frankliniella fusca TaxID=407009 RepID=A0AAE1LUZ0_9NEOP|nr:GDSL esterase/lipase ESM1 [Frankliniella fusca]
MSHAGVNVQLLCAADRTDYVVKEFSVYDARWDVSHTVIFAPPYPEHFLSADVTQQNAYVTNNIHGLRWNSGTVPYSECADTLRSLTAPYAFLCVKGEKKKNLLLHLIPDACVVDVGEIGCPKLEKLARLFVKSHCVEHSTFPLHTCAALNAKRVALCVTACLLGAHGNAVKCQERDSNPRIADLKSAALDHSAILTSLDTQCTEGLLSQDGDLGVICNRWKMVLSPGKFVEHFPVVKFIRS